MKISAFLKQSRLQKGLTQANVAERLGLTPQAVSKWERGESMPDITLLPELAGIYGVSVEAILSAGTESITAAMHALNAFVDERIFEKVRREFEHTKNARELTVPLDVFMALNARQKDTLLALLLAMTDYSVVIDDVLPYLNAAQRTRLVQHAAESGDYETLAFLIPFMTRVVRTEVVMLLLQRRRFDFLEEMLLFLNHEQKDQIIRYFLDNDLDREALDSFLPFFDRTQRRLLESFDHRESRKEGLQ